MAPEEARGGKTKTRRKRDEDDAGRLGCGRSVADTANEHGLWLSAS